MNNFIEKYKTSLVFWALGIYWAILLFLTSLPGNDLPDLEISDKIEHVLAFWGLAVLLKVALVIQNKYSDLKKHSSLFALIIIMVYAAFDELHQLYIPGRSCDILDWTADVSGAIIAVLFISVILKYWPFKMIS